MGCTHGAEEQVMELSRSREEAPLMTLLLMLRRMNGDDEIRMA